MRKFVFIGGISNSNMAASSGKKRHKSTGSIIFCVCLLSSIVPYCQTFSLPTQKLTLSIPHTARKGFTVLKTDLKQTCIEIDHIQRSVSNRRPSNPFSVQNDGSLVIQAPAYNFLGDLFVIRSKKSKSCQRTSTVSQTSPVYVEIVYSNKTLHFVRQDYTGSIHEHAPVGTKVNGIQHLYACSALRCSNNLEYRIVGSNDFYLETISNDGHIQLEIYTKSVLQSGNYNFMIVSQNADGLQGHTSIEVKVTPVSYPVSVLADENLYFSPRAIHRHKRATQETLTTRSVDETKTGFLFSVKDPNNDWKYTLASSTYQNAFTVSETGDVSVAPGFKLDYETLTADGISNPVQLVINVLEKPDDTLVKELIQPVTINDINDELPVFTNKPTPFLAAVSLAAPPNTLVYTLTAADPDAGANLTLALSPAPSSQVANFFKAQILGTTAEIRRIGNQQFTENQEFRMNFIATDNAAPDGTTQRTNAEVQILAGARKPQFMENTYLIEFEEKNAMDQVIATVEVYSFQQNPVTFTVLDENLQTSTVFGTQTVTNPTGPIKGCHIIVKKIMDYETPPRTFSVKIRAQEDNTGLFSDQDATISVKDNNEFEPRFNASTYKAENTREDIAVGSALLTVAATDADFNTKLTFSVDNDHFRVEANDPSGTQMPQTATIYVNKKLDYDRISPKNYDFHVRATDDGEISKTGEATVRIFMTNQNDEPPVFPDPMTADLRYNAEVDQQVTIIQATDADQGDKVSYAIVPSNARFEIESNTGRITLKQSIPANIENYELVIQATDDGGCCDGDSTRHTSTGTLTINILYDNLARPEFTDCLTYQPEVSEEQADAFVIRVTATDTDIGSNGRVTYSIRESNSKFRINSATGELYTAEKIDREALGVSKTVPVNVIATDGGNLQGTCSLLVKIIDINDNAPIFVTQTYDFPVEDTSLPNSVAAFVEATDADSGLNGEVQYSFTADGNPGGYFRFDDPSFTGQIKVNKTLQQDATITLTVKATDRGIPSLSSNVTVIMRVTSDPTQLPPQWGSSGYSVTVNESISSSNNILTFSAQSRVENNVKLVFRVVDQNSIFMTDNIISTETLQQGNLRLKPGRSLDFETTESYSLTLRASDVRNIYSDQRVTITVTDTNDNVPVFVGTSPETGFLDLSLLEGNYTNRKKEVGQIRAIDNDKNAPNNQIVGYAIVETDSLFTIDAITGMLYTQHEFDRENPSYIFTITVEAIDGAPSAFPVFAGRPNTGTVNVKITIEDVNDNPPSFPQQSYTFEAPEDLPIGDRLPNNAKVTATDPDSAAVLTYSVSPLPSSNLPPPFSIQTQTGHLTVAGSLDYDKGPAFQRYEFIVNVFDSIHSSSTTVTINVKNVNDNSPVVGNYQFNDFVEEDASVIGPIATVNASDIDGDIDGDGVVRFWYELKFTDDKDQQYFSIDRQSGVLSIVKRLDRDQPNGNAEFIFTVEVADEDPNDPSKTPRYGFGEVVVRPIDINDNPPMFPEEARQMTVMENQNPGTLVGRVEVIDYDEGINAEFDLTITGQLPNQVFTLDVHDIETTAKLDRETIDKYFVTVQAVDKGPGRNTGSGTLTISVGDENDNAPFFNQTYSVLLSEHQLSGKYLLFQPLTLVRHLLIQGALVSRWLWLLWWLKFPRLSTHCLTCREKVIQLSCTRLQVLPRCPPVPEIMPKFLKWIGLSQLVSSTIRRIGGLFYSPQCEFARVKAYDEDIGPNAVLTYTLASKDTVHFRMDKDEAKNEGVLKVYQPVDYDDIQNMQRNFNLTVYAVDPDPGPDNKKRAETFVEVVVTDYNDEVPTFVIREKTKSIPENAQVGTLLETFIATDKDVDEDYKTFEYYISRESDPTRRFTINQQGEVSILNPLDRETTSIHVVHILAIDNVQGSPQNTGTATLTVSVTDINDNCPDFAQDYSKTVSIMENQEFNDATLVTISAIDADEENNGQPFSFELTCNDNQLYPRCSQFRLTEDNNGDNGRGTATIYVSGTFDREHSTEGKTVSLPIKMCDLREMNRGDQQCCTRILDVTIQDQNDNKHEDGYQNIVVYNYKGLFGDIKIGQVNANDPDDMDTDKQFTLLNPNVAGLLVSIDPVTGDITLKPGVPDMSFEVQVRVEDQAGLARTSTVRIHVIEVSEDAVYNSGSIRIDGISPEDFIFRPHFQGKEGGRSAAFEKSMLDKFQEKLAEKLYGPVQRDIEDKLHFVQIISVMGDETHTDVRFAAHGSPYYQSSRLNGIVTADKTGFENLLQTEGVANVGKIDMVPIDMCQFETCEGGCFNKLVVTENPKMYNTKGSSYVGVDTNVVGECGCRATQFPAAIECTPGYCYHGGVCNKNDWGVVSCDCPDGFEGPRCQKLRQSFDGTGYALYKQLEQCEESRTSIEFMTKKGTALILYNGPVAELDPSDPRDFILLELVNGKPRLRINHGTGEIEMSISGGKNLNDGAWHRIDIFRNKKNVRMVVDHCVDSNTQDRSDCEVSGVTRGENVYINVIDVLQLGGRLSSPSYPANVLSDKFDGCMKNLIHNREVYDLSTGNQFPGAKDGCKVEDDACPDGCGQGQCLVTGVSNLGALQATCVCNAGYRKTSLNGLCNTDTTKVLFKTQSYMDWQIKNTFKAMLNTRKMTVSFHFRTRDPDGLMFYVSHDSDPNKYILFKIVSSKLQVSYNLGDDAYDILLSNVPNVADGYWHMVTLERYGKEFILKMDSGEGRYYTETLGPVNGLVDFTVRQDQIYGGASVTYSANSAAYNGEDFENSCLNDIRYDIGWFPMQISENQQSPAATVVLRPDNNTELGCDRNLCTDTVCSDPFVCKDLWGDFSCVCKEYYIKSGTTCVPIDYCADGPCFGSAACSNNVPPKPNEELFKCRCLGQWYGPLCQCHPDLNPGGKDCVKETDEEPVVVGMAGGVLAAIILGILVLIVAIVLIAYFLICRKKPADKEPFDEDMDDDIRENIMYYDEEGAGEEDHTQYDLSRLRKPDTGEHPSTWDAPDIRKEVVKPVGSSADRPEVGDFIHNRLNDADDDPNSPPYDTPHDFNFEGGSSDAGSLSSLNTDSSGSQDYDYLNEWGPKFAKLADMYNNYDDAE
ncbi:neural-cadherin-like [Mercenaria mercenaria]|uniref:neural-cadherin-like n=1 Tax=Mercenaria mercenaria TaxID=6596 RepID=UPI00234ECE6E|nr:neural-cadherin-like [Mercenaria mercenaria]